MENNNNDGIVVAPELPVAETAQEISQEDLAKVVAALKSAQPTSYKSRMQGLAGTAKLKVNKFWHNGNLVSREAHDNLSWEEIHASNNIIRK